MAYHRTPQEIWGTFTLRQITGFFKILQDVKIREIRFQAALHGAKMDDTPKHDDGKHIDTRNITTAEDWARARAMAMGRTASGAARVAKLKVERRND